MVTVGLYWSTAIIYLLVVVVVPVEDDVDGEGQHIS